MAAWITKLAKDSTKVKVKKIEPTLPDDPPAIKLEKARETLDKLESSTFKPNYAGATTVADSLKAEDLADSTYIAKVDSLRGAIKKHQYDSDVEQYGTFVARLRRRTGH